MFHCDDGGIGWFNYSEVAVEQGCRRCRTQQPAEMLADDLSQLMDDAVAVPRSPQS